MLRFISKFLFLFVLFQSPVSGALLQDRVTVPIPGHAHNDYLHERPLFDALENGFRSIEADVFAVGDSLYVAHDRKDIRPGRTFRKLYMEPLIDYICKVSGKSYIPGSVMVIVSGNRPIEYMRQQTQRKAFVDGRMKDLSGDYSPLLMPLVSDRWTKYFSWKGRGDMPENERTHLKMYVQQAHDKGQLIRFWATPDKPGKEREAVWKELLEAGVDLVNTDDLGGLHAFLTEAD